MSAKTEIIESIRKTLSNAKSGLYDAAGNADRKLFKETLSAFSLIKEYNLTILSKEVYQLLESDEPLIRQDAVATLGFTTRLHLPEFRDKAYEIFLNDPDDSVKATALNAWTGYYFKSNNRDVLKILYNILIDNSNYASIRDIAYHGIFTTIDDLFTTSNEITRKNLLRYKNPEEFNQHIDWQELEAIMRKYAPEALD